MNFADALELVKAGKKAKRSVWTHMWIAYSPGAKACPAANLWSPANRELAESLGGEVDVMPAITLKTTDNKIMMGWTPSQADMLAEDWAQA